MKLSDAVVTWREKGFNLKQTMLRAKKAVAAAGKTWTKRQENIVNNAFLSSDVDDDTTGNKADEPIPPSQLFYGQARILKLRLKPEKPILVNKVYKLPKSKFTNLRMNDEVIIRSDKTKKLISGIVKGFNYYDDRGEKGSIIRLQLTDGYAYIQLAKAGKQFFNGFRNGKPFKPTVVYSETSADAWWDSLSKKQQTEYIKLHPKSKHAKNFDFGPRQRPSGPKPGPKKQYRDEQLPGTPVRKTRKPRASREIVFEEDFSKPRKKREKVANPDAQVGFKSKLGIGFKPAKPKGPRKVKVVDTRNDGDDAAQVGFKSKNGIAFTPAKPRKPRTVKEKVANPDAQVGFSSRHGIGFKPAKMK